MTVMAGRCYLAPGRRRPDSPVPAPPGMSDLDRLDALRLRADAHPARCGALYAEALRRAGRLDEAIRVIRATLDERPRNVFGQIVLARCFRDVGHLEEAALVVRDASALDATDPIVHELAYLLPFAPQIDEPVVLAPEERLVRDEVAPIADPVPPPPIFVTETMAELYVQQGLPDHAAAIYRELTARAPGDDRLVARLAEVEALAATGRAETRDAWGDSERADALHDLPLLEDFDPIPVFEEAAPAEPASAGGAEAVDEEDEGVWVVQDASEPASVSDLSAMGSAFDFSEDAQREADPMPSPGDAMLEGLSFDAIALPTPSVGGWELAIPMGSGPSARDALRELAGRPVSVRPGSRPPSSPP
ncbi:MAG: hypothetical protein RL625_1284, partial [Gemmatimonadota bacterium]